MMAPIHKTKFSMVILMLGFKIVSRHRQHPFRQQKVLLNVTLPNGVVILKYMGYFKTYKLISAFLCVGHLKALE